MTETIVVAVLVASYIEVEFLACIPKKIQVPCIMTVTFLTQKHVSGKTVKGMYRIAVETLHPA